MTEAETGLHRQATLNYADFSQTFLVSSPSKVSYSKLTELGQTNGLSLEPAAFGQRESQVCFCFCFLN